MGACSTFNCHLLYYPLQLTTSDTKVYVGRKLKFSYSYFAWGRPKLNTTNVTQLRSQSNCRQCLSVFVSVVCVCTHLTVWPTFRMSLDRLSVCVYNCGVRVCVCERVQAHPRVCVCVRVHLCVCICMCGLVSPGEVPLYLPWHLGYPWASQHRPRLCSKLPRRFPEKLTGRMMAKDSRQTTVMSRMMWRWKDR